MIVGFYLVLILFYFCVCKKVSFSLSLNRIRRMMHLKLCLSSPSSPSSSDSSRVLLLLFVLVQFIFIINCQQVTNDVTGTAPSSTGTNSLAYNDFLKRYNRFDALQIIDMNDISLYLLQKVNCSQYINSDCYNVSRRRRPHFKSNQDY